MDESTAYELFQRLNRIAPETVELLTAETEKDFDVAFDTIIEKAITQLEKNKKKFHSLDEEGLSGILVSAISMPGLTVTQEENSNGHVDITIKVDHTSPMRIKLGEAKIWRGKEYHASGLDQLLNRYSTGRECRGFVISYVKIKNIKGLFDDLKQHMDETKPYDLDGLCKTHGIKWSFLSSHKHDTGELMKVCHIGCNLFTENDE